MPKYNREFKFEDFEGLIFKKIDGMVPESGGVYIETTCGRRFSMEHMQDCCEYVRLEDVSGDVEDLIGTAIRVAEERTDGKWDDSSCVSQTWTFYTFRTDKGTVDLRWLGESNGYYSEKVDVLELTR